jgi:hypothetical protein
VQALFRGKVIGETVADNPRPDVAKVTGGNPNCGFVIEIKPPYDVDLIEVLAEGEALPIAQLTDAGDVSEIASSTYQAATPSIDRPLRLTEPHRTSYDDDICRRLLPVYQRLFHLMDDRCGPQKSMWAQLLQSNFQNISEIVARGDAHELCEYLLRVHKRPETWGIAQGPEAYTLLKNSSAGSAPHQAHAALYSAEVVSLAEYLEVLPVENLGQGRRHDTADLARLIEGIRASIGIDPIYPHMAGGLFCLDTGAGLVQQRDIWALYTALRVADLLRGRATKRICEIGGGLGQVCHYAKLLGLGQYVLVDLPHVSLLQAFTLMRHYPNLRIALYDGDTFDLDADICIYPTFLYERAPNHYFDVTINVDSMPEMDRNTVLAYARTAARKSMSFLSINQEARGPMGIDGARQNSVEEIFAEVQEFERRYRFRSWVRRGYVESLYLNTTADGARFAPHAQVLNGSRTKEEGPAASLKTSLPAAPIT